MKLEAQFFHFFFYPFLIGVACSSIIVIVCSLIFSNNYLDKITGNNIVELGKEYTKININSISELLVTRLLKMQLSLTELILLYQKLSNKLKTGNPNLDRKINEEFLICVLDINDTLYETFNQSYNMAYWILDLETNLAKIKPNSLEENQLIAFSKMIQNVYSVYYSTNYTGSNFYFYFESTELYLSFPLSYDINNGFINEITNYTDNPVWCTNDKGEVHTYYKTKCRGFYDNIKKSKTDVFDINYKDNENRTIFVTEFYTQVGIELEIVFTICIEFNDPLSNKLAYLCADINSNDLNYNLDNINSKLSGYFFVNSVGFSHSFYYPGYQEEALTITENMFSWGKKFFLEEKTYFSNNIQRLLSSNYIKYIKDLNNSLNQEIYINGENNNDQIFYINREKFFFSIYPIVLVNYKGIREHVLNIVYIYNNNLFYDEIKMNTNIIVKIILILIVIVIFGSGLLYIIVLSFNTLAKYIVIPIKNVNYMLKGINIGGKNRLEYLDFLKKRQDDNIDMLEKINLEDNEKDKNNNDTSTNNLKEENNEKSELKEETDLIDNNNEQDNTKSSNDNEIMNSNITSNYKKFEEENDFIEKESTFYNFDEQLLQYRPLEVNRLINELINLKGALLLTSTEQQVEQIINYSNSEEIFRNFKNKEGTSICQSNIGNLQSQLLKFDKAIYHLASSLQDNKLKGFLNRNLNDEFDDSDTLLHKILISFKMDRAKIKNNILLEKQLNNTKNNFSQKVIGILINSRYNKLIHVYFRFFSLIQKLNVKALNGLFMNTHFHNINYYHKIIIQYIYLSFIKNDLVKIGESILDYIQFLIKFKFKTSPDNKYILDIRNKNIPELNKNQKYKRKIFNKILNWFQLFDEYIFYVRNNTTLADDKSLIDDFSIISSDNNELNPGSQSLFLFKVNLQRSEFLKGKFAMLCNNYTDALFYFIRAAKKNSIVLDGLIKKKSLKRIYKIISKLSQRYDDYGIMNWKMKKKIKEYEKTKIKHANKKNIINSTRENSGNSFKKEFMIIIKDIIKDLDECNAKQTKDIIIIIDFNTYNQEDNDIINNKINSFIDQTISILDNYLSINDRFASIIYKTQYQIICPLVSKDKIDIESFSKDLTYYKKTLLNENEDEDSSINELKESDLENEKMEIQKEYQYLSDSESHESFNTENKEIKEEEIIKGLVDTINYTTKYLKLKEDIQNEKYIILFTDIFNNYNINDKIIMTNFDNLNIDKEINFLLVGKNKEKNIKYNKNTFVNLDEEEKIVKLMTNKFGEKSDVIDFENMKKIKTILSSNNFIEDEIIYPNEIYK